MAPLTLVLLPSFAAALATPTTAPFVELLDGLTSPLRVESNKKGIRFNNSWLFGKAKDALDVLEVDRLPSYLCTPDYVKVYSYTQDEETCTSLLDLARAARSIVDLNLSKPGAVLFRNLDSVISSPHDFKEFWSYCCEDGSWTPAKYLPYGPSRSQLEHVDLATNIPAQNALPPHNEMSYNPKPPSRIAFYCLHPAKQGGETLVVKNEQLADSVRKEVQDAVSESGGLLYVRQYSSRKRNATGMPWQEKCGTDSMDEAVSSS